MYTIFTLFLFLDFYFELTFKHLKDVLSHIGVQRYFKFIRTFKNGQQVSCANVLNVLRLLVFIIAGKKLEK